MLRIAFALAFCAGLTLPALSRAETWKVDPNHTSAQFSVRHMGISTVRGAFKRVSGTVDYDPKDPTKSAVDVTIDAASVDTRVDIRDKDLKGPHFLDVEKYPAVTFKSTKVEPNGPGKLKAIGDLTIHGVTKQVMLDIDGPTEPVKDGRGNLHMGASATTKIDRTTFGMDQMTAMVGTDVTITIDAELITSSGSSAANSQQ